MTAPSKKEDLRVLLCCAACLQAITAPEQPVRFEDCFFHASHLPAEADVGSS